MSSKNKETELKSSFSSVASNEATKKYAINLIRDASISTVSILGFVWLIISVAKFFELDLSDIKSLGGWGYTLIVSVSLLLGTIFSNILLFISLRKEWINIEIASLSSSSTKNEDSETKLSDELVLSVRKIHQSGSHSEVVRLCSVLSRPLWLSGRYAQQVSIGTFYEDSAARLGHTKDQAMALIDDIGWANSVIGNISTARKNIKRGIRVALDGGYYYIAAKGHRHLGTISLRYEKQYGDAEKQLKLARQHASKIADEARKQEMQAGIDHNISEVYLAKADYENAKKYATSSVNIYTSLGDRARVVKVESHIARIHMKSGDLNEAKNIFHKALTEAKEIMRRDEIGKCLLGLGEIYLKEDSRELAKNILEEAIGVLREIGAANELDFAEDLYRKASSVTAVVIS